MTNENQVFRVFVEKVADLIKDGEVTEDYPDGYDRTDEDAVDTLASVINWARQILDDLQPSLPIEEKKEL